MAILGARYLIDEMGRGGEGRRLRLGGTPVGDPTCFVLLRKPKQNVWGARLDRGRGRQDLLTLLMVF